MSIATHNRLETGKVTRLEPFEPIHPMAVIHPTARLGRKVTVGPFSVIGADVVIGDKTEIMNHVTIQGPTTIGQENRFFPYCSIGQDPQDKKFAGQTPSLLEIGDRNVFREFVTIHRGTPKGRGCTSVGHDNWIMAYCHIAHDCRVGNHVIFANGATLGGHVTVQDMVYLGGITAIHQYCEVGELVMTGGHTMIAQDVPPYVIAAGNRARLFGVNKIGMERNGVSEEELRNIQKAYRIFFRGKEPAKEALARLERELAFSPGVKNFVAFIRQSERGICR
ncbi:MAG: acyl-ACP--UDP-N-acetylglucosamine O-acyltransferase [SAR324 cluster bacterium]|nr:acyl-ACP--UDP-N-acetylglucosamine O-acyltransferase [SAR324 cluster bacterium]